jgi:hypothetical protein
MRANTYGRSQHDHGYHSRCKPFSYHCWTIVRPLT